MRKPWKEAGLGLLNLLAFVAAIAVVQFLLGHRVSRDVRSAVVVLVCLAAYLAASKWIERRRPSEFDIGRALPELSGGLVLGIVLFTVVMGLLWACRVYRPAGFDPRAPLASGLLGAMVAGIVEEILFRGLLFRLSCKIVGTWGALLFTAGLFGVAHAFNPGATVNSSLAIALEAGILLGAAYAATARLWLPIGLHIGWNFTEGSLFGMSVSGRGLSGGLVRGALSGPPILTGGEFGPEASLIAVLVCLAAALYLIRRIVKLDLGQPPVWSKSPEPSTGAAAGLRHAGQILR